MIAMRKTTKSRTHTIQSVGERVQILKTPQSVIHIKHNITLRQYKYWIILLRELKWNFDAGNTPDSRGFFSVSMEQISEYMGYLPVKEELKSDLATIRKEPISFNSLDKDGHGKKYYEAGFISEFEVTTNMVRYKFPSILEETMRGLDSARTIFSLINWQIFNHFDGKYEAIIYKLCKDYEGVGRTPRMSIEDFREYMGIRESEYPVFKEMNRSCIHEPISEINRSEISDITVSPEYARTGRKVNGLHFKIAKREQLMLPLPKVERCTVFDATKIPISPMRQVKYLEIRTPEQIELCIVRANERIEQAEKVKKPIRNLGAYYDTAIREGWHDEEQAEANRRAEELAKKEAKQRAEIEAKEKEQREAEERQKHCDVLFSRFKSLPDEEKNIILAEVFRKSVTKKYFDRSGIESPIVRAEIILIMKRMEQEEDVF